jgi:hypothetical protein
LDFHNCNIASIIKCHQYLKLHPIDATGGNGVLHETPKGKKIENKNALKAKKKKRAHLLEVFPKPRTPYQEFLGKTERYPPPKFSTCVHLFPTLQFMAIS